jgi:AraC-like DNA-binding protein
MTIILNIGIILSVFLALLLFSKKNKSLPDNILAFLLFIIGFNLTGYYLSYGGYWTTFPHLTGINAPAPLLFGPLLFLYVKYSINASQKFNRKDVLHFLPVVIAYIGMIPFFLYSAKRKQLIDSGEIQDYAIFSSALLVACILSGLVYAYLSFKLLSKRKRIIAQNYSFDEKINLNWLQISIFGVGGVFIVAAVVKLTEFFFHYNFPFTADILFYAVLVGFVVYVGYSGIRQQHLFTETTTAGIVAGNANQGYLKSGLKSDFAAQKHAELKSLMKSRKPYLNPRLTLSELAQMLEVSPNHLSQIINQQEKVNFHDFVNSYRVEEFIRRAKANKQFSILAHALDSGFNSKSSFNNVFKKHTSKTPSQYLKTLRD